MDRRIVITGLGVLASTGIGKKAFWDGLKEGRSGMKPSRIFAARGCVATSSPPMSTRSGFCRSLIAVPSARNSGFDRTWKRIPRVLAARMAEIDSAVLTGMVDFSTMIFDAFACSAIVRATDSI